MPRALRAVDGGSEAAQVGEAAGLQSGDDGQHVGGEAVVSIDQVRRAQGPTRSLQPLNQLLWSPPATSALPCGRADGRRGAPETS